MNSRKKILLGLFVIFLILVLAGVFSCSRLPTIVPDLARRPDSAVQLTGAWACGNAKQGNHRRH
jgi:hypothetical protein